MQPAEQTRPQGNAEHLGFAGYYREHYAAVFAYAARRIDDVETAREISVDVFRIAWPAFAEGHPHPRGWLLQAARNQLGDAYRRRERERRLTDALALDLASRLPALDDDRVAAVLDALPTEMREVLALSYWDRLPASEIAQLLDITTAAVWMRLHRARRAFRQAWTMEDR